MTDLELPFEIVLADPGSYGLFTEDSITDLNLGGAMIQKSGSNVVVNLQLQTTPDLSTSFTNHGEPVGIEVDLPGDQHFLRIRALGPQQDPGAPGSFRFVSF